MRYASLRYFNVAGAIEGYGEAHEPESHLIPLILDVALGRRENIKIFGQDYPTKDGTCVRDYIHVRDLAEAHLLALGALEERSRLIYNIGNGQGFTVLEVIESVRRVTGKADCGGGVRAARGRSGGAGGELGEDQAGAGMEAAVCGARCDSGKRVGVAPEAVCVNVQLVVAST